MNGLMICMKRWKTLIMLGALVLLATGMWYTMEPTERFAEAGLSQSCVLSKVPDTVVPVDRKSTAWTNSYSRNVARAQQGGVDVAFYGDSITEGMNVKEMRQIIGPSSQNFGISGDGTQHLLWRFQNGELDFPKGQQPKVAVVLIGTNNIWQSAPSCREHDVFLGVKADVDELRKALPDTKVLIVGILPRDRSGQSKIRAKIQRINSQTKTLADNKRIWYVDIGDVFLEQDGSISRFIMSDYLHPTALGDEQMFNALKPHIDSILAAP